MVGAPILPTVEYLDSLADSRRWRRFCPRADDIVVSTPAKSGTTWVQAIVALLLSGDPETHADPSTNAPWIDSSGREIDEVLGRLEAQTKRRQVKTHTPFDGIPFWPDLTYICVYRHPVDVYFSWRKHQKNMTFEIEDLPFVEDLREGFQDYVNSSYKGTAGVALSGLLHHYRCALAHRHRANVLLLHYGDMTRDLAGSMARVAEHLGIGHPPDVMMSLVEAATFDRMKANAHRYAPGAGRGLWKLDEAFFDSASSKKWVGRLSEADLAVYEERISRALPPAERAWLEWGSASWGDGVG